MTNADVARLLGQLATMLEMDGANPFRIRAYREAARVIEGRAEPVADLARAEGGLESLAGIGKDLAGKIRDIVDTGTTGLFDEMKAKYPLEVVAFTELQGMGPKRVKTLFEVLGVRNRDDLEREARAGRVRDLPGFGATLEQKLLKALDAAKADLGRMTLHDAWEVAHALAAHVGGLRGVRQVELAGSFRRRRETIGDLDILATGGRSEDVMHGFVTHREVAEVLGHGDTKSSVRLRNGLQVDLRLVAEASFGAALLYFTGSKAHNIELRKRALDKGLSLNEYGLTRGDRLMAGRTEEDVYRALGLAWIPPELREATGEIALAAEDRLPRLIEPRDLRADLHMHTTRSDGRDTLETMVRACRDRGYAYCAITEHSKSLAMTGGFDAARVRQSVGEIEAVRRKVKGIEVLHGLEVDILPDGALDLEEEGLALLDWVIVSLHLRLGLPREAMTARVLRALEHPAVHAMGHPTARHIGSREPSAMDLERVFDAAAARGVAMEINAQPHRVDLSDVNARLARAKGLALVIDTDAHDTRSLDYVRYGVFAARRAGLTRDDVLNARPYEKFKAWLEERRGGARAAAAKAREAKPAAAAAAAPTRGNPARAAQTPRAPAKRAAPAAPAEKAAARVAPKRKTAAGSTPKERAGRRGRNKRPAGGRRS